MKFQSIFACPLGFFLISVLLAPLGMLYDDVPRVVQVATGLLFFLTPVVYPPTDSALLRLNPVSPLVETGHVLVPAPPQGQDAFDICPVYVRTIPLGLRERLIVTCQL